MLLFKTFINPIDGVTPLYDGTEINSATINSGGNGYAVNDMFTINSGNELSIGKVLTVTSGAVASFSILFSGIGYIIANNLTTNTINGVGSGLIVNVTGLKTGNTKFCHSVLGNDSNAGTRSQPVQTLTKCQTFSSLMNLANGSFVENSTLGNQWYFEGESYINGDVTLAGATVYKLHCKSVYGGDYGTSIYNSNITILATSGTSAAHVNVYNSFVVSSSGNCIVNSTNNTINVLNNNSQCTRNGDTIISIVDLYRFNGQTTTYLTLKYCLFRKATLWKWNGVTIPINYIEPSNYIEDVWNSLYSYANSMSSGTDKSYFLLMLGSSLVNCPIFYTDSISGQTNKVIDDNINTGVPIFNKYASDNVTVLDFSLSLSSNNIALTMGDPTFPYQFVGCYRPNIGGQNTYNPMVYSDILNVNTDGTDDVITTPNLLMIDNLGNFLMNQDSIQFWNRILTNVLSYDRGKASFGTGSMLNSGLGSGYYFGKKRKYDITHCVIETIEILPYDDLTTPSTSSKFSMSFNGQTLVYFWVSGIKIGQPVLFSDLAGLGIIVDSDFLSIYGTWAVSTADLESYSLSQLISVGTKQYPLTYFKGELNAHYKS